MRNKHYLTYKYGRPTDREALRFYAVFGERWFEWYRFVKFLLKEKRGREYGKSIIERS